MVHGGHYAPLMGIKNKLSREERALGMEQRLIANDATLKDAQIKLSKEECAKGMEQRLNTNDAAVMDAPI
jgi:hypothetical protein